MELHGKAALAGGGTAGIGLDARRLLARADAEAVITGRDVARGKNAADAFRETGTV